MSVSETIHLFVQRLGTEGKRKNNLIVAHVEDPYNNLMESIQNEFISVVLCCRRDCIQVG